MFRPSRVLFTLFAASLCLAGCADSRVNDTSDPFAAQREVITRERDTALLGHHDKIVEQFVKLEGSGFGRMPILAHSMPQTSLALTLPGLTDDGTGTAPEVSLAPWFMEKVELVSLLVNEKPGAYPMTPGMVMGRRRPATRELDDFETAALERIRTGETIEVRETAEQVRVMGAVRVRAACVKCHEKPEGTLLGAFTYSFKPGVPPAAPFVPPAPLAPAQQVEPPKP